MKHILLVEDDEDIQSIYKEILQHHFDVKLSQAFDGRQGLAAVRREKPDLIILDILMPVMSGDEFLKEFRLTAEFRDVPVIVCSVNQTLANNLHRQGLANAVMPKLFAQRDLIELVVRFLGIHPKTKK
ncbi:MAG: response regulator [Candidatus Omnitrophica bacterium]|jgi:CheY-like chemotaxis protein|nr:response regulator [Candidatus Omnitrophota bacterium]